MEDNKLIAEFMGMKYSDKRSFNNGEWTQSVRSLSKFQTSWDWLMPVVDKIESFEDENRCAKYNVNMLQCWVEIINNDTSEEIVEAEGINKRQATYKAVVEFIKHINK